MGVEPPDRTVQTRMMRREPTPARAGAPRAGTAPGGTTLDGRRRARPPAARDALLRDEALRTAVLARLMFGLGLFGFGLIPLVQLDRVGFALFCTTLGLVVVAYGVILWLTSSPARWSTTSMGLAAQIACLAADTGYLAFGPFSAIVAATAVPVAAYALGSSFAWSFATYAHNAIGHIAVVLLINFGVLADHAMVPVAALSPTNQAIAAVCVQAVFFIAFVLGRQARARTERTIGELEQAVRQVAERDALLAELHHQLDAAREDPDRVGGLGLDGPAVGSPGRFTGHELGSFQLGEVIGRGGMGEVYEARHLATGAPAAVKLLARGALSDPNKVARFVRELDIARALDAPNLVRVLEVGDPAADLPYLAMERLVGQDLSEVLRTRRRLELGEVVELVRQVAVGLSAAHAAGIVHRDLKPSNVFLTTTPAGAPLWKVLDFGVGKLAAQSGELTRDNIVGTPGYMAPEQARGVEADARADVYALAAIAYRALTGRAPVTGADVPTLLYRVVHAMPPRPGRGLILPEDVDAVLAVGLAKEPGDRFASAADLAAAFAAAARSALAADVRARAGRLLARRPWESDSTPPAPAAS